MLADKFGNLRKEAHRVHESVMYSAQNQFEYSKTWRKVDRWLGATAALLAATSAAGGLSEVLSAQWVGLIAFAAAGTGAVATTLGAPKAKDRAHASANALLALQQDARIFIEIDLDELEFEEAREQLRALVARQQQLNTAAEIPSPRAWKRAQKNVAGGQQTYEVDEP
ncbi:MAG: SLATT domain-containing protein [Propionibacteriaceae bacterium]|nr:SLATT domain-containing protein [Propionibacteriaceae bacterium]